MDNNKKLESSILQYPILRNTLTAWHRKGAKVARKTRKEKQEEMKRREAARVEAIIEKARKRLANQRNRALSTARVVGSTPAVSSETDKRIQELHKAYEAKSPNPSVAAAEAPPSSPKSLNARPFTFGLDPMGWTNNEAFVCPHCHTKGHVRTRVGSSKVGVSGAKATAALLTAGVSLLAVGLSRKARITEIYCGNCRMDWTT